MTASDNGDEELIVELFSAVKETDLVPPGPLGAAYSIFELRNLDEELEMLTILYDSSTEKDDVLRGVTYTTARYLTFQAGQLSLEVEINDANVLGQVIPPQCATLSVVTASGEFTTCETDDMGSFLLPRPAVGPIRITCKTRSFGMLTDWIAI